jgi:hypothetical protein
VLRVRHQGAEGDLAFFRYLERAFHAGRLAPRFVAASWFSISIQFSKNLSCRAGRLRFASARQAASVARLCFSRRTKYGTNALIVK